MAKRKAEEILETLEDAMQEATDAENMLAPPNLSTGCELMNLAISDHVDNALGFGRYMWYEGGSSSGKSYLTLTALAEAARNPAYEKHRLVFLDGERGAGFDLGEFFGDTLANRLEVMRPETLEQFYDTCDKIMADSPAVIVLDSFDSVNPESTEDKIDEDAGKREKGEKASGSYQMEHGKIHSQRLRRLIRELHTTNSVFIGVSQQRDNISNNMYAPKNKTSGGRALKYWSSVQVETQLSTPIKKKVEGKDHVIGNNVFISTKKNRISGKSKTVSVRFIHGFGIDNTGSTIEWLTEHKYFTMSGARVSTPFYEKTYFAEELAQRIEGDNYEDQLKQFLQQSWTDLENKLQIPRKKRY